MLPRNKKKPKEKSRHVRNGRRQCQSKQGLQDMRLHQVDITHLQVDQEQAEGKATSHIS